ESPVIADLLKELVILPACRGLRVPGDHLDIGKEKEVVRVPSLLPCFLPRVADVLAHHLRVCPEHEYALRVPRCELPPPRRCPGLVQHRRTLWGGLRQMAPIHLEIFSCVLDISHLSRIGV